MEKTTETLMKTVVAFLSRSHGYDVLKKLTKSKDHKILKVYTHKLNPKSQDPKRHIRDDFHLYEEKCKKLDITLVTIDDNKSEILNCPVCDFIVEVSWRYLIPENITKKAKIAAFGIHRGKLPDYAGAEPIKKAIKNNEKEIVLSAHFLEKKIDFGDTILSYEYKINYDQKLDFDENIQKIREEITKFFGNLVLNVMAYFEKKK